MTQPLFLDPTLSLEKVAYDTRIDDDPDEWPIAVVRESYKQLPFLKGYETEVELDKTDSSRGYGVGKLLVWPARMEKAAAAQNKQLVTVPIIIRNSEMAPLDVYSHQVLFRPETFERGAPRGQFSGTNLFGQLTPPNTDHNGAGTLTKQSSVKEAGDRWKDKKWVRKLKAEGFTDAELLRVRNAAKGAGLGGILGPLAAGPLTAGLGGALSANHGDASEAATGGFAGSFLLPVPGLSALSSSALARSMVAKKIRAENTAKGAGTLTKQSSADFRAEFRRQYGFQKTASEGMYSDLLHTFRAEDKDAFAEKLASVQGLRQAFTTSPLLRAAVADMADASEKTASDVNAERRVSLRPTVVQITQNGPKDYMCKIANHRAFDPEGQAINRFDVQKMLTEAGFADLLETGVATFTTQPLDAEDTTTKVAQEVTRVGVYRTYSGATPVEGLVIPHMVDFDGKDLGMQVFVGHDRHSLQDKVAGVHVRDQAIDGEPPHGLGVYIYQEGDKAVATEPVRIEHTVKVSHEASHHTDVIATRMSTGAQIRISSVPGLRKMASIGGTEIALPSSMKWMALHGRQLKVSSEVEDVHILEDATKLANANSVELISDGSSYSIRGDNAAAAFGREILTGNETAFALCSLGLSGEQATEAMKTAAVKSSVHIPNTRRVLTLATRSAHSLEKAASIVSAADSVPRADLTTELALLTAPKGMGLWKEASVILSRETTDAILSLGFVTPENASLYVNYLPELEKVASKLAELLVASRLGMDDVRESSAKNAMTQVNAVIRGLETMRERIN